MLKHRVRAIVVSIAVLATIVVVLGLPAEGFQWANAQVYDNQAPTPPVYTGLPGIGFVLVNDVAYGGRTFNLGAGGYGQIGSGSVFSITSPAGYSVASIPPQAFLTGFQRYLQTGLLLPPQSQFITNPEGRRMFTQPYAGGEVRGYYLFTSEGTSVFQLNVYQGGVLTSDRVMLFVAPNGNSIWVYRSN